MTAIARLPDMPDWPARMTAPIAALYMGVSQSTFLNRFGDIGVKEGANTLWAKVQLDRIIARQFRIPQPSSLGDEGDESWADLR